MGTKRRNDARCRRCEQLQDRVAKFSNVCYMHIMYNLGVSKNRRKTPKMDGLLWKTLLK